ncbi:zinc-binding dehydrogenase [Cryptosporangium sp. NPDC051539]|uniref:zinc-binding dehydrogenase n=1 Tax=Cryptosporangium sp. NPDC051539 TaxID=3363962 RepID=UPI0037AC5333
MPRHREVRLVRRPVGRLSVDDLVVADAEIPPLRDGEVLVRNTWLSVDAAVRLRLDASGPEGYLPPVELGRPLEGLAIGAVVESRAPGFEAGQLVEHARGYREFAVVTPGGGALGGVGSLRAIDERSAPPDVQLGLLGGTGLTAWAGLTRVAALAPGDVVWISAAAGAVGSVAAQLARERGNRVIGSAGTPAKVAYLRESLGLDAAFDYHDGLREGLAEAAPEGIDVYFDNVGGSHLEAALAALRPYGRVALCGAVAGYDGAPAPGPGNLFLATAKNLTLRGFRAGAFAAQAEQARDELGELWRTGRLRLEQVVHEGLESAPAALIGLLNGQNVGKVLVRL